MHRTGVQSYSPACKFRNYKLTATQAAKKYKLVALQAWKTTCLPTCFFFFFLFSFLLCFFLILCFCFFFFGNQTHKVTAPQHKHRTVQNLLPFFKIFFIFKWNTSLTPYRHDKTTSCPSHRHKRTSTSLSPHRLNTNTQANSHTGYPENISLQPHRRKTTILPPHRRNTKNYNLVATQATKLLLLNFLLFRRHTGVIQTTSLPPHRHNTKYKLATPQA